MLLWGFTVVASAKFSPKSSPSKRPLEVSIETDRPQPPSPSSVVPSGKPSEEEQAARIEAEIQRPPSPSVEEMLSLRADDDERILFEDECPKCRKPLVAHDIKQAEECLPGGEHPKSRWVHLKTDNIDVFYCERCGCVRCLCSPDKGPGPRPLRKRVCEACGKESRADYWNSCDGRGSVCYDCNHLGKDKATCTCPVCVYHRGKIGAGQPCGCPDCRHGVCIDCKQPFTREPTHFTSKKTHKVFQPLCARCYHGDTTSTMADCSVCDQDRKAMMPRQSAKSAYSTCGMLWTSGCKGCEARLFGREESAQIEPLELPPASPKVVPAITPVRPPITALSVLLESPRKLARPPKISEAAMDKLAKRSAQMGARLKSMASPALVAQAAEVMRRTASRPTPTEFELAVDDWGSRQPQEGDFWRPGVSTWHPYTLSVDATPQTLAKHAEAWAAIQRKRREAAAAASTPTPCARWQAPGDYSFRCRACGFLKKDHRGGDIPRSQATQGSVAPAQRKRKELSGQSIPCAKRHEPEAEGEDL